MKLIIDYKTKWEDCCMLIHCPNCDNELYLDSQNGHQKCSCGKTFILSCGVYEIVTETAYTEEEILSWYDDKKE